MAKQYSKDELAEWFEKKALQVSGTTARNRILSAYERGRDDGIVGKLYVFRYKAKGDGVLPRWDKYPMTLVLQKTSDGFLGLNLHYLGRGQRGTLLYIFNKYKENYKLQRGIITGGTTNWDNLLESVDGTGMESYPKGCLKRYLYSHVGSKFIEIYPDEYDKAIQLPIEEWVIKR